MRTVDVFGVLRPMMGQVKNCPLFQAPQSGPPAMPSLPTPPAAVPGEPSPTEPTQVLAQGVSLSADIQNEAGETPRGIILYPGADPAYLVAEAFGVRADAPASAMSPAVLANFSVPMMMTDKSPARIVSSLASSPPGIAKKVWFWKIDRSPLEMEIPSDEMKDLDGTWLSGIVWKFPSTGSFYVAPDAAVTRDGEHLSMRFSVKVAAAMGRISVQNDRTAWLPGVRGWRAPFLGVGPVISRADLRPASK